MSIEQHAEAAAKVYKLAEDATDELMMENDETVRLWDIAPRVISKHMQAAIDEATAPLRARIAELEGLGPLIGHYGEDEWFEARFIGLGIPEEASYHRKRRDKFQLQIEAILKGGAP